MFSFGPIKTNKKRPDWTIIVNQNECNCLKLVAQKLSPKIRSFLKINPDAKKFEVNIVECTIQRDLISSLFFGKEIQFSKSNHDLLLKLSIELDISELYNNLLNYQNHINTIENLIHSRTEIAELIHIENLIFLLSKSTIETIIFKTFKVITPKNEDVFVRTLLSFCIARHSKIELLIDYLFIIHQNENNQQIKQSQQNFYNINIVRKFCDLVLKEFFKEISHSISQIFDEYRSILQELCFIIFLLIDKKLLNPNEILKENKIINLPLFFAHLLTTEQIKKSQKNNFFNNEEKYPAFTQLMRTTDSTQWISAHLYNARLGLNSNPLPYTIRFDRVDDFMKLTKTSNFKNDGKINPCIYERCTFVNDKPKLIEYAAFFGSIEIFKYFILNCEDKTPDVLRYAVCSGNSEIIRICSDLKSSTYLGTLSLSIEYHHQVISEWLIESKNQSYNDQIAIQNCLRFCNFEMFVYMLKEGVNANFLLIEATHYSNLLAVTFLLQIKGIDVNIQEPRKGFTPLHYACSNGDINIVQSLLNMNSIQINKKTILTVLLILVLLHFYYFYLFICQFHMVLLLFIMLVNSVMMILFNYL